MAGELQSCSWTGKRPRGGIRKRNGAPWDRLTLKFEREPGCSGKDLILLRLRSRTSSAGISVTCRNGKATKRGVVGQDEAHRVWDRSKCIAFEVEVPNVCEEREGCRQSRQTVKPQCQPTKRSN